MSLGVISDKNELYGFKDFDPIAAKSKSCSKDGIFIRLHKEYFSLSSEASELLNEPKEVIISLDDNKKRVLLRQAGKANHSKALNVVRKSNRPNLVVNSVALMKKMREMFGAGETVLYGHHIGRMADETNGIIFSLEDNFR